MGLDIYLYPKADHELNAAYWAAWEAEYKSFDAMTPAERAAWNADHPQAEHVDAKSAAYPEHYFNRRYLRSSYNGGGFNRAVPEMTGTDHDLYWIFEPVRTGEESPDLTVEHLDGLRACRERALQVVEELRSCDRLRVTTVEHNPFMEPARLSGDQAMTLYRKHVAERSGQQYTDGGAYGTREGDFYPGGFEILATLPAVEDNWRGAGRPVVHLIYRQADEGFDFYLQAAEITVEFCDEAIALVERDGGAHMSWSG